MPTTDRKLRVFLCHASQDKPVVRELYQRLLAEGWIDPWLDEEKLLPGQDWDMEIERAVESADAVIVCLSNHSVTKEGYVQKELRLVFDKADEIPEEGIFIVPLRLDNCVVPRKIRTRQYVDYYPKNQQELAYRQIVQSLQSRANNIPIDIAILSNQPKKDMEFKKSPNNTSISVDDDFEWRLANEQARQIKEFDLRLRKAMPGSNGYAQARNKKDINRVMREIGMDCGKYQLWWNSGYQHDLACPIDYYADNDLWVINGIECKISDLWTHRHPTLERQYVVIQTEPMQPFGIYDPSDLESEEAGYFEGRYVSYGEYYDGFALIDGESVELINAEYRCRFLQTKFFILAPQMSVYIWGRELARHNDNIKDEVFINLINAGKITVDLLRPLEKLKRDEWMTYLD